MISAGNAAIAPSRKGLTPEQRRFWDENGFLILPSFYTSTAVEAVLQVHADVWRTRPRHVIVDNLATAGRYSMDQLSEEAQHQPYKINDLYLSFPDIRALALDAGLMDVVAELLADAPVLCNTLSLDYGTEEHLHADSLYMTPPGETSLVATWVALEDCHADAGPESAAIRPEPAAVW